MIPADLRERERDMVLLYGEACSKKAAARILHMAPGTINAMLQDGRLDAACQGTRVDVRSIARYLVAPAEENHKARRRKAIQKSGCKWRV